MVGAIAFDVPIQVDVAAGPNWLDVGPLAADRRLDVAAGADRPGPEKRDGAGRFRVADGPACRIKSIYWSSEVRSRHRPRLPHRSRSPPDRPRPRAAGPRDAAGRRSTSPGPSDPNPNLQETPDVFPRGPAAVPSPPRPSGPLGPSTHRLPARVARAFVPGPDDPPRSARASGVDRIIMPRFDPRQPRTASPTRRPLAERPDPRHRPGRRDRRRQEPGRLGLRRAGRLPARRRRDRPRPARPEPVPRPGPRAVRRGDPRPDAARSRARRPIDRRALGAIVFADPRPLRDLEAILHPAMRKTFEKAIARESRRGRSRPSCSTPRSSTRPAGTRSATRSSSSTPRAETRLARLEATRGWTAEVLAAREKAQGPLEEKRRQADHVLANDGTPEEFRAAVDALWPALVAPPRRTAPPGPPPTARGQPSS